MERMIALGLGEAYNAELLEGIMSPSASPVDSLSRKQEIESAFCSDFRCCGQHLPGLHDLLHHYEEHHACTHDDNDSESFDADSLDSNHLLLLDICYGTDETVDPLNTTLTSPPMSRSILDEDDNNLYSPLTNTCGSSSSLSDDEQLLKTPSPPNEQLWPLPVCNGSYKDLNWLIHVNQALLGDAFISEDTTERPYKCEVSGCDKAYKNINGLKYHKVHGHCNEKYEDELERSAKKPYHCAIGFCRKRYKNLNGLKYHIEHTHMARLRRQQLQK